MHWQLATRKILLPVSLDVGYCFSSRCCCCCCCFVGSLFSSLIKLECARTQQHTHTQATTTTPTPTHRHRERDRQRLYLHVNAVHTHAKPETQDETSETAIVGVEYIHLPTHTHTRTHNDIYVFVYVHSARALSLHEDEAVLMSWQLAYHSTHTLTPTHIAQSNIHSTTHTQYHTKSTDKHLYILWVLFYFEYYYYYYFCAVCLCCIYGIRFKVYSTCTKKFLNNNNKSDTMNKL